MDFMENTLYYLGIFCVVGGFIFLGVSEYLVRSRGDMSREDIFKILFVILVIAGGGYVIFISPSVEKRDEAKSEDSSPPIELKVNGENYNCRLNDSSDDGKAAYLCQPILN